jgi:pyridoxal phosphate enzyme (YggS family)
MGFLQIKKIVEEEFKASLVAVSKTRTIEEILEIYNQNQRIFGENRVQEVVTKFEKLPKDIEWHLIGSLQKNKVKYIAPFIHMIHSVDSYDLAKVINKEAQKSNRAIKILLQIKIADEETKQGLDYDELKNSLAQHDWQALNNIEICGVMGMATLTDNSIKVRSEFKQLSSYFLELKNSFFASNNDFKEISMGMSGDYNIALEEGSTMVRIGSAIFEQ